MMNTLYSSWNNALDYSRYPRGNTAPTVLPQMHYRYRCSTVHSVPSQRYYREIIPIPTVITAVTAVLPHSPLPCHSLVVNVEPPFTGIHGPALLHSRNDGLLSTNVVTNAKDIFGVVCSVDHVPSIRCLSWPLEADDWLTRHRKFG